MKLHLIRHTTLDIPSGVCYGQSDVDVSENFHAECDLLKDKLAHIKFDAVYASPLQRCVKLANALDLAPIQLDHRLKRAAFWRLGNAGLG